MFEKKSIRDYLRDHFNFDNKRFIKSLIHTVLGHRFKNKLRSRRP